MNTRTNYRLPFWIILTLVAVLALAIVAPSFAQGVVTGEEVITGGSLAIISATNPTFTPITLNGADQTASANIAINVTDYTGTGAGWKLQMSSTAFTNVSARALNASALSISSVAVACATGTCTDPTNSYTYGSLVVTTDGSTVVPFFNAAVGTGLGNFTITPSFLLAIPADTYAGTYNSTMTVTVGSAP